MDFLPSRKSHNFKQTALTLCIDMSNYSAQGPYNTDRDFREMYPQN